MKYYNEYGEEIFSPQNQKALNRIRQQIGQAERRLDRAYETNSFTRVQSIKAHLAFLERQERSFYK